MLLLGKQIGLLLSKKDSLNTALVLRSGHFPYIDPSLSLAMTSLHSIALVFIHYLYFFSATVVEDSFEYLDAPVERIAGADVPTPYAANLERMAFPQVCAFLIISLLIP